MDLFGRRLHCHPAVQVISESQGCHKSPASLCPTDTLCWLLALSTAWPVGEIGHIGVLAGVFSMNGIFI